MEENMSSVSIHERSQMRQKYTFMRNKSGIYFSCNTYTMTSISHIAFDFSNPFSLYLSSIKFFRKFNKGVKISNIYIHRPTYMYIYVWMYMYANISYQFGENRFKEGQQKKDYTPNL